jgi:hypothetical protein
MTAEPRLSFEQRACYYGDQLVTGNAIAGALISGAMAEWQHKPPEWPQGFKGLGEQAGTRYAQSIVKSTGTFLVATMLREDPRPLPPYDPSCTKESPLHHAPPTGFWPRFGHSVTRVVWNHNNAACRDLPSVSRIAGSLASGFVQLAWAPPSEQNVSFALRGSATALGGYVFDSVFNEFESDIFGIFGRAFATGKPSKVKP